MKEITEEQYKVAESNGINRNNLRQRVRKYGMSIEEATTKPINRITKERRNIIELRKKNGISTDLFYQRVKKWNTSKKSGNITSQSGQKQ
ncbi:hypothetical protein ACT7CN_22030 [Bacillus cereus]